LNALMRAGFDGLGEENISFDRKPFSNGTHDQEADAGEHPGEAFHPQRAAIRRCFGSLVRL
jgi:hypothetical protein